MLDFSLLQKAIASLEKAILWASAARDDEERRDAVIRRFEHTYELCWKMLKRRLEVEWAAISESFNKIIEQGCEAI